MARPPTRKFLSFARRIMLGDAPMEALENSEYGVDDWTNKTSKASMASRLFNDPRMPAAIAMAYEAIADEGAESMSRAEAIEQWTLQARGSMGDIMEFRTIEVEDINGKVHRQAIWAIKGSDEMTADQLALIQEIATTPNGGFKVKLRNADEARKQLAKLMGWDAPPKTPVGQDGKDAPPAIIEVVRTVVDPAE